VRHFGEAEIEGAVGLADGVECLRTAFLAHAEGATRVQARVPTELGDLRINTMAAIIPSMGCCGAKVYTATRGRFAFVTLLFSIDDGSLLASFDAGALTTIRTAAASVLAASRLARPDSEVLAIFGTGRQAAGHAMALAQSFPLRKILVVGRGSAPEFAREVSLRTALPVGLENGDDAARQADIVVTATRSRSPLFDGRVLREGVTVIAVGSARPDAAEVDASLVARCARIVVESAEQARHEAGDLLLAEASGASAWGKVRELGDVLAGRVPGRESPGEVNLFESLGFALEDVAIAALAWSRLKDRHGP